MPRAARKKCPEAVYHIMARSITEFDMFPENDDKDHFLNLLQQCKEKYCCRVYSYCLMTNHYHILLDTNGFDVSIFMKVLNLRYVKYINKKYGRRGSLLAERFQSKIITNTEYALTVSAYIHNNPKDIEGYTNKVFEYPYSSMGIFMGIQEDRRKIIETEFILGSINENDRAKALTAYVKVVEEKREMGTNSKLRKYLKDFKKEQYESRSYRKVLIRDKNPDDILEKVAKKLAISDTKEIMHKWKRNTMELRGTVAYALTVLCGMGTKEACEYMKNISGTCLGKLRDIGFEQFKKQPELWTFLIA